MKYLSADELDVKIVSVDGDMCVVDAGLPFMLRIPRQSLSDEPYPGRYIGFEFEPEHVGRSALERTQARIAALIRHIADGALFNVTMKGRDGEMAELSDPAWPEFSFQTNLDMLSAGGRITLESGKALTMMSAYDYDKIDPSKVGTGFKFVLKRRYMPRPVNDGRYEAIVVDAGDDYLRIEANGFTGTLPVNTLFYEHRYENRPKQGDILTVRCVSHGKLLYFKECVSEAEEREIMAAIRPGDIVKVFINEYCMTEKGYDELFIDFAGRTHVPALTPEGLNARTYIGSGVWSEGKSVKARVCSLPKNLNEQYKIMLLPPKESDDVFGLPVGTVVDAIVTPGEMRFTYNDRDYLLTGADVKKSPYIKGWLADFFKGREVHVKAQVADKNNFRGPKMRVNPTWLFEQYSDDDGIFEATLHDYIPGPKIYVFNAHGMWFRVYDNLFNSFPPTYRPPVGAKVRFRYIAGAMAPFEPVYDREETEYTLAPGCYHGKVTDSYLNGRYVVETPAGLVTATVDETYPPYIVRYFVDTLGDVMVTVGDDGSAMLTVDGLEFDRPITPGELMVEVVCRRGYGALVRYDGAYGFLPAQAMSEDRYEDRDIEEFVAKYAGRPLCAYMIPSILGERGIYFSLFNPAENPYIDVDLAEGDEVDVRVTGVSQRGHLEVMVRGVRGLILKSNGGYFMTGGGVPARYDGEVFRAVVTAFKPVLRELQLKAKVLTDPTVESPWKRYFNPGDTYDVEVVGYIGNEVVVRGKDFVGSLFGESNLIERLTVNRQMYPVGKRMKAMLKRVEKLSLTFSVSYDIVNKFNAISFGVGMRRKATVIGHDKLGVVFDFDGIPALMTRRAALERATPGESIESLYPLGSSVEVSVALIDTEQKGLYVIRPDSPMLSYKGTRLRGTVKSLPTETNTYCVLLETGVNVDMPAENASWNVWFADLLEIGKEYDFVVAGVDFSTHLPTISHRDTKADHWADMKTDKKVVDVTVVGFTKGQAIVAFGDVRQTLSFPLGAYLAGRPWSADKSVGPDDIHVGSKFKLRVRGVNRKTRSYMLWPYFGAQLREIGKGTVDARIEHVGPDGVWVSFDSPASGRSLAFVRTADLSHARIDSPVGFFHEGDCEKLALCRVQDFDGGMLMSRKALIAPAVPGAKAGTGYVKVKVRGVARDKALVFVDGVERLLSTKIFDRKPVKDGVYSLHRAKIR